MSSNGISCICSHRFLVVFLLSFSLPPFLLPSPSSSLSPLHPLLCLTGGKNLFSNRPVCVVGWSGAAMYSKVKYYYVKTWLLYWQVDPPRTPAIVVQTLVLMLIGQLKAKACYWTVERDRQDFLGRRKELRKEERGRIFLQETSLVTDGPGRDS